MSKPVQKRARELITTQDLSPIRKMQVSGDNDGHALVKGGAELKEQLGASGGDGNESQLVQYKEPMSESCIQELGQTIFLLS